jgi:hypothetical protein
MNATKRDTRQTSAPTDNGAMAQVGEALAEAPEEEAEAVAEEQEEEAEEVVSPEAATTAARLATRPVTVGTRRRMQSIDLRTIPRQRQVAKAQMPTSMAETMLNFC